MMEASAIGFGLVEFLVLLFGGNALGLIPGERDPLLMKSAPASAYLYGEWTAQGPGLAGAPGIEGFIADPEIQTLMATVSQALAARNADHAEVAEEIKAAMRAEMPALLALAARHSGGLYLARDEAQDGAPLRNLVPPLEAAVILNLDRDLEPFVARLNRVLQLVPGYTVSAKPQEALIPAPLVELRLHQEGPRLILAVGAQTLQKLRTRWQQPEAGVSQLVPFQQSFTQVQVEKFGSVLWINLASLRNDVQPRLGWVGLVVQNVMKSLGLSGIESVMTVAGIEKHDQVSRTHVALSGPGDGVLALFSGRPVVPADLAHVPSDADFVAAVSLNLGTVHGMAREVVGRTSLDVLRGFDSFSNQLEQELQLKLADLFGAFDDVWTVYDAPSTGGVFVTGLVVAVPVRDAAHAEVVVNRLRELVAESLPTGTEDDATTLREMSFDGQTIHYVNSSGHAVRFDGHSPFSPAFCLTKDHFLFALHPQALKAHLRFVKTSDTRFSKTALPQVAGDVLAQVYVNTPRLGQVIYPLVPLLAKPAIAEFQAEGLPVDMSVVPSARAVLPYLRETTAALVRRGDGLFLEQRNTLPVVTALMLLPQLGKEDLEMHVNFPGGAPLKGRNANQPGAPAVQLGAADGANGVVQAKADDQPAPAKPVEESPLAKAARRSAPAFLRGVIPDVAQGFIPPEVFQRLAEPPDPAKAAERAAERQRRKEERDARRAIRRGVAPQPVPRQPSPPQPSPP